MLPAEIIRKKRDGAELTPEDISGFIGGYVSGDIADYQVSAMLMAIFFQGMTPVETADLTRTMMRSGRIYEIASDRPIIDKHSTGGVGDKVSLILAPLAAACGLAVPMVAGRGLGHTGGTLDKLQSIPGFSTGLSEEDFLRHVKELGVAIIGQSEDFVPADKKLYALRDVTGTVECIPLLCSSILSKKVASGAQGLVMDVKCGTGAFMEDLDGARTLARALCSTGAALGLPVRAVITDMNQPLGHSIGNAMEVRESIDCLRGGGPPVLREIVIELTAEMLLLAWHGFPAREQTIEAARRVATDALDSGAALDVFRQMIERQGGEASVIDKPELLPGGCDISEFAADRDGFFSVQDCRAIGLAALALGAGRRKTSDAIDPAVGLVMHARMGDPLSAGQQLISIHSRQGVGLDQCRSFLNAAISIVDQPPPVPALIIEKIS